MRSGAQRQHGGGRLTLKRSQYREVFHVATQQVDHAQRGLAGAAIGLDEQRQPFEFARGAQESIEARDVVLADGALGGIPIRENRLAKQRRQALDDGLRALHENGRLGDPALAGRRYCAGFSGHCGVALLYRSKMSISQSGIGHSALTRA